MSDLPEKPANDERAEKKGPSWYIDENGNVKGHTATIEVDSYVEFTDLPKNQTPNSRKSKERN